MFGMVLIIMIDILLKMNISPVLYTIVYVVCTLSGIQGQSKVSPTAEYKYL